MSLKAEEDMLMIIYGDNRVPYSWSHDPVKGKLLSSLIDRKIVYAGASTNTWAAEIGEEHCTLYHIQKDILIAYKEGFNTLRAMIAVGAFRPSSYGYNINSRRFTLPI